MVSAGAGAANSYALFEDVGSEYSAAPNDSENLADFFVSS